jgi:hypothetical protein
MRTPRNRISNKGNLFGGRAAHVVSLADASPGVVSEEDEIVF